MLNYGLHTDKQTHNHTDTQTHRQTVTQTQRQTETRANSTQTHRHTQTNIQTDRLPQVTGKMVIKCPKCSKIS